MANVKISELPNATSLSNGDSFPVVQGGVTKQAARSVLFAGPTFTGTTTAAILTATGDVTFDGGAFVFNDSGADKDARFEGDTDANLLFLDASTDRVGVGTSSPVGKIDSVSNATAAFVARASTTGANQTVDALTAFNSDASLYALARYNAIQHIWRYAGTTEAMRLDASGNVGIGTSSPTYRLDVSAAGTSVSSAFRSDQSEAWMLLKDSGTTLGHVRLGSASGAMLFYSGNSEKMRITAAGDLIHQVNGTAPTLSTNSTMSFELTSNTSLKIVVRGTDGTTRSVSLTLA
jgi:hypothetical protein